MNLLLDSHAFVWMHEEPHKLSVKVAYEILNPAKAIVENMTLVSADANFAEYEVNLLWQI